MYNERSVLRGGLGESGLIGYVPLLIFSIAVLLKGAKTALAFSAVGLLILAWAWLTLWKPTAMPGDPVGLKGWRRKARPAQGRRVSCGVLLSSSLVWFFCWSILSLMNSVYLYQSLWLTTQVALVILFALLLKRTIPMGLFASRFFTCFWGFALLQALLVLGQCWSHAPYGLFPNNPNWTAGFIGTALISLLARAFSKGRRTFETHRWGVWRMIIHSRFLLVFLTGLFAVAVLMARSRGAFVGSLCGLGYLAIHRWQGRGGLVWIAALLGLYAAFPTQVIEQFFKLDFSNPFANQRLAIWGVAIRGALDHPFLGYGLGNFEHAYDRHAFPVIGALARYGKTTAFAHNEYLQMTTELGLPALFFVAFSLWKLYQSDRVRPQPTPGDGGEHVKGPTDGAVSWSFPAKAGLLVLLTQAFFDLTFHLPAMLLLGATLFMIGSTQASPFLNVRGRWGSLPGTEPHGSWLGGLPRLAGLLTCLTLSVMLVFHGGAEVLASQGRPDWATRLNPWKTAHWKSLVDQESREFQHNKDPRHLSQMETSLRTAIRHDPQNPFLYEQLARLYSLAPPGSASDFRQALWAYHRAIACSPHNALFYAHLGAFLLEHREPKRALPYFREAIRLEPFCFEAYHGVAACYIATQQWARAEGVLRGLLRLKDQSEQFPRVARTGSAYEAHLTQWHPQEFQAAMAAIHQALRRPSRRSPGK